MSNTVRDLYRVLLFAVIANALQLRARFSRTGHPRALARYFLHGSSNIGSVLALLAYPVLLEPLMRPGEQSALWPVGSY